MTDTPKSHQLINQDSGNTEYYTPASIVSLARDMMGAIDLDPFSSLRANQTVLAGRYYTIADDGLKQPWFGRVWMNHPFGREMNAKAIQKLVNSHRSGAVTEACCITYASTSETWFRPLLDFPQCFIYGRTNYRLPNGTTKRGVTKGSVVTYMGPNVERFKLVFSSIGRVKV